MWRVSGRLGQIIRSDWTYSAIRAFRVDKSSSYKVIQLLWLCKIRGIYWGLVWVFSPSLHFSAPYTVHVCARRHPANKKLTSFFILSILNARKKRLIRQCVLTFYQSIIYRLYSISAKDCTVVSVSLGLEKWIWLLIFCLNYHFVFLNQKIV